MGYRYKALDSWRGICALIVALFHLHTSSILHDNPLVLRGWLFVDFFFVLSGFVIAFAYEDRLSSGESKLDYLFRRLARIWPLHVAVLIGYLLIEVLRGLTVSSGFTGDRSLSTLPANLLLLQGLGFFDHLTWNLPSWSISVEWALYIIFAIFIFVPRKYRIWLALASVIGTVSFLIFFVRTADTTYEYGVIRGIAGFALGYLVRHLYDVVQLGGTWWEVLAALLAGGFVILSPVELTPLAPLVFSFTVLVFATQSGAISRLLAKPAALALGDWSYSIYMIHSLVISCMRVAFGAVRLPDVVVGDCTGCDHFSSSVPALVDLITLIYVAAICVCAFVTHRFIELPPQGWAKSISIGNWLGKQRRRR